MSLKDTPAALKDFSGVQAKFITSVADVNEFMRWLGERRPILAFDTETEGLHFWEHDIRLAQFGDGQTGWAIPFGQWAGVVGEALDTYTDDIVGHNVRFDLKALHRHGMHPPQGRFHDTMLQANALWPHRRIGLKGLATAELNQWADQGEAQLEEVFHLNKWDWASIPVNHPVYWSYGALDTVFTARLHELLMPQLRSQNLLDVYEMECAVSRVLYKMETRGAHIDVAHCEDAYAKLHDYTERLRDYCERNYGFPPGSKDKVIGHLQEWGFQFTKRTDSGALALDEDVLLSCKTDYNAATEEFNIHPLAQLVVNVRKNEKIANTYLKNFIALADEHSMLHPSVKQVGAKTGRMSCLEPNLQNLPRDGVIVRNAFTPIDSDHTLVSIDYEQVEMRIFAHFAKEEEMLRRIRNGVDLHTAVAQMVYGLGDSAPLKYQRSICKNANFAKVYGAGYTKFAETAHITTEEGRDFYNTYEELFPGVKRFQEEVVNIARKRYRSDGEAWVRAPSGRKHVADVDVAYKVVNYLIQGTAADVLKKKMIELDNAGIADYLWLIVHDECLFDFPKEDAVELGRAAAEIMVDPTSFSVPLTVDVSEPMDAWTK